MVMSRGMVPPSELSGPPPQDRLWVGVFFTRGVRSKMGEGSRLWSLPASKLPGPWSTMLKTASGGPCRGESLTLLERESLRLGALPGRRSESNCSELPPPSTVSKTEPLMRLRPWRGDEA